MQTDFSQAMTLQKLIGGALVAFLISTPLWAQENGQQSQGFGGVSAQSAGQRGIPTIVGSRVDSAASQRQRQAQPEKGESGKRQKDEAVFTAFVETVTGTRLPVFGKDLFSGVPSTFAPSEGQQVNADYVIGAGDELQILGWGMLNIDLDVTVDRSGAIYIPSVGSVKVAGVRYGDLQGYLKKAVGKFFSNFELSASIAQTRAVQVYVVGHAVRPGTYTLNAMSTLLNALFTSGGPDASGTMRSVQLRRGGRTITTFDLYDMLVHGDKTHDATLRDGDVIFIPEAGPLVAVTGNVKVPAIYELNGPSSVADVVGWAGGIDAAAEGKRVVVERTVNNVYETVGEIVGDPAAVAKSLSGISVQPADVLRVFSPNAVPVQAQIKHEYVRVSGELQQTGVFELRKGETLRELVARLGGPTDAGYVYATQLKRESVRQSQQAKLDEIADRFERDIESSAAVRTRGTTDKESVDILAAELDRQRRMAQKLRSIKAEGRIVLELENGNAKVKDLPDLPLQDGDSIVIPRKPGTVDVLGSVFQSNAFIYKSNRTVDDYVQLAGGVTQSADASETYVIHADGTATSRARRWFGSLGASNTQPGDTIVVPESIDSSSWRQTLKEWTAILYQFGLGAAGLKVLKG